MEYEADADSRSAHRVPAGQLRVPSDEPVNSPRTAGNFADNHRSHPGQHAGRRPGTPNGTHPYTNDPRLELALEILQANRNATNSALIRELQKMAPEFQGASRPVWNGILNVAREMSE